jgi:hypothetical protein
LNPSYYGSGEFGAESLPSPKTTIAPDFRDLRTELKRLGYTARDIAYDYGYQTTHVNRFLDGKLPADDPAGKQLAVFLKSLGVGQ